MVCGLCSVFGRAYYDHVARASTGFLGGRLFFVLFFVQTEAVPALDRLIPPHSHNRALFSIAWAIAGVVQGRALCVFGKEKSDAAAKVGP